MPYKFESEKKVIGNDPTLDKRYRLTNEDKENIKRDYETGLISIHGLAKKYNVSKRTIQFTLFPERKQRNQELSKERRKDGRYYDKEQHKVHMKAYRDHKKELDRKGLLVSSDDESTNIKNHDSNE